MAIYDEENIKNSKFDQKKVALKGMSDWSETDSRNTSNWCQLSGTSEQWSVWHATGTKRQNFTGVYQSLTGKPTINWKTEH